MKPALALVAALLAATVVASGATSGPYDGLYVPEGMNWSCRADQLGMDGGALAFRGDELVGVENYCKLTQPTQVRGMNAVLFDAVCSGEGEEYTERVMLMPHFQNGIYIIRDGGVADWRRCG